jgi:hypothetical protein
MIIETVAIDLPLQIKKNAHVLHIAGPFVSGISECARGFKTTKYASCPNNVTRFIMRMFGLNPAAKVRG